MPAGYFYSLVFSLLTSLPIAAVAAPAVKSEAIGNPIVMEVSSQSKTAKINLNTVDASTLQRQLAGIGAAKANAIVAYRETNGPFASVDELLEVKGIGKAILDRNREKLEVN